MPTVIRALAVLGAVWAVCLGVLILWLAVWTPISFLLTLLEIGALLFLFQRLYRLKRWALTATCVYCCWMAAGSPGNGIWLWTLGWGLVVCLTIALLVLNWRRLEPGV